MAHRRHSHRVPRPRHIAVALTALCCAAGGCASGHQSNPDGATPGVSHTPASAPAAHIDGCALVSQQDIANLLGTTVAGQPTGSDPDAPGCKWDNPANDESISLQIGNHGTAPNNTLPTAEPGLEGTPGPDGMRFLGGGQVEFAAGERSNTVQVAVLRLSADDANAAAADLARKMTPKIPA